MADDLKLKAKYKELKKRIRDIEDENDSLNVRLYKARKSIKHLKLERTLLLDRMEKIQPSIDSDHSDVGSELLSHDDPELRQTGKHGRLDKMLGAKPPRRKKDPNAPKGPGNVFFLYCRLERDKIKDQYPQENLGEVTKILGQRWKSLKKEEKQKYYDMYKKEMEEYEEAMKSYTNTHPVGDSVTVSVMSSPGQSFDPLGSDPMLASGGEEEDGFVTREEVVAVINEESTNTTTTMTTPNLNGDTALLPTTAEVPAAPTVTTTTTTTSISTSATASSTATGTTTSTITPMMAWQPEINPPESL
ncbi:non-histone protein [Apophysomyces ossiformis]|uniref:Non-histone protein n=1 Tax=Apophysomyces ossiformis TaxID=679940 RepID=A0A8H7BK61_9FUNG|nr:non-histone protein [Apophysomyces ossiformis]